MRWDAYIQELGARLGGKLPNGFELHFSSDGEVTNEVTPAFPCGWDERDAKV